MRCLLKQIVLVSTEVQFRSRILTEPDGEIIVIQARDLDGTRLVNLQSAANLKLLVVRPVEHAAARRLTLSVKRYAILGRRIERRHRYGCSRSAELRVKMRDHLKELPQCLKAN